MGLDPLGCIFGDSSGMYVTLWVLLQKAHVVRRESNRSPRSFVMRNGKEWVGDYFWDYASCVVTPPHARNCLARGGTMFSVHWNS